MRSLDGVRRRAHDWASLCSLNVPKRFTQGTAQGCTEQVSERILEPARHARRARAEQRPRDAAWKIEELQRFTRVTAAGLAELVEAGLIAIEEVAARRDPLAGRRYPRTRPLPLTAEQSAALEAILASAERTAGVTFLLHGVTGSGKTEVYLQALAAALAPGKRAHRARAGDRADAADRAPLRRALSGPRRGAAQSALTRRRAAATSGGASARAGATSWSARARRSSRRSPDLGLIVVDEEHEASFKQDARPLPRARRRRAARAARRRDGGARQRHALPRVATSARGGRLHAARAARARRRRSTSPMPHRRASSTVRLVDLRAELRAGHSQHSSARAARGAAETLARGEQAILFLNRRGMRRYVLCRDCGYVARCTRCDIALTYHATERDAALPLLRPRRARHRALARSAAPAASATSASAPSASRTRCERNFRGAGAALGPRHDATTRRPRATARAPSPRRAPTCWSARR